MWKNSKLETKPYMKKLEVYVVYQNEDLEKTLLHAASTVLAGNHSWVSNVTGKNASRINASKLVANTFWVEGKHFLHYF